jgi:hypothetical protein
VPSFGQIFIADRPLRWERFGYLPLMTQKTLKKKFELGFAGVGVTAHADTWTDT